MLTKRAFLAAATLLALAGPASAATIYDESVSGDAGDAVFPGTQLGTLGDGASTVLGTLDADLFSVGFDRQDSFTFSVLSSFTIDLSALGGSGGVLARLFLVSPVFEYLGGGSPGTNLFGTIGAGTYSLSLITDRDSGTPSYSANINVAPQVPLPAALPLLATGLGALGFLGRRKRRQNIAA